MPLAPSFDAIRRVSGHRHRAMALSVANESRRTLSSAGDGFAVSFWSSGQDSGRARITETRETGLFRATGKRGHEVGRGRKARQIAPKREISAFLGNTMGSKKPTSKRSHKVLLEHQWLMARGRTPPNRQSFRGCPNVISLCLLMGCKGRLDGGCGRLPVSRRIAKTRQIAFVGGMQKANCLRRFFASLGANHVRLLRLFTANLV